jgi:hypothetical protein
VAYDGAGNSVRHNEPLALQNQSYSSDEIDSSFKPTVSFYPSSIGDAIDAVRVLTDVRYWLRVLKKSRRSKFLKQCFKNSGLCRINIAASAAHTNNSCTKFDGPDFFNTLGYKRTCVVWSFYVRLSAESGRVGQPLERPLLAKTEHPSIPVQATGQFL